MNDLHSLMDEKVDVYSENERFQELLSNYYKERNDKYLTEMWPIMYRCASNILKRRFGKWWDWVKISDKATEMTILLMSRITNTKKYPKGYTICNLPTQMKYALMNVVYGPSARKQELEDSHSSLEELLANNYYDK